VTVSEVSRDINHALRLTDAGMARCKTLVSRVQGEAEARGFVVFDVHVADHMYTVADSSRATVSKATEGGRIQRSTLICDIRARVPRRAEAQLDYTGDGHALSHVGPRPL